jgi:hypothetical protein
VRGRFFLSVNGREGDGEGERRREVLGTPVGCSNGVTEGAVVKCQRREKGDGGVHPVLPQEHLRVMPSFGKPLKQGLSEPRSLELAGGDDRTKLFVVADEDSVLHPVDEGDYCFRLQGLSSLVDEEVMEGSRSYPRFRGSGASADDDGSAAKHSSFSALPRGLELLRVKRRKLTQTGAELEERAVFGNCRRPVGRERFEVRFEGERLGNRRKAMSSGVKANCGDPSEQNLLGQVVASRVRRSANEHWSTALGREVVDQRCSSLSFPSAGRSLDKG